MSQDNFVKCEHFSLTFLLDSIELLIAVKGRLHSPQEDKQQYKKQQHLISGLLVDMHVQEKHNILSHFTYLVSRFLCIKVFFSWCHINKAYRNQNSIFSVGLETQNITKFCLYTYIKPANKKSCRIREAKYTYN